MYILGDKRDSSQITHIGRSALGITPAGLIPSHLKPRHKLYAKPSISHLTLNQMPVTTHQEHRTMNSRDGKPVQLASHNLKDFLSRFDTLLVDCDGVMWRVGHYTPLQGIAESAKKLKSMGKKLIFATNNSIELKSSLVQKMKDVAGFEIEGKDLFAPAYATAVYLKDVLKFSGKCYVVGSDSLALELKQYGIDYVGMGPDSDPITVNPAELLKQELDPDVRAVIIGYDKYFCYNKMFKAVSYLCDKSRKCVYIALNETECGTQLTPQYRQPITGAMVAAISTAADKCPVVTGKPHTKLMDCIRAKNPDIDLSRTLMIGDSIWTDIPFAKNCGITSVLSLSGESKWHEVEEFMQSDQPEDKIHVPDYYINSFGDFAKYL